VEVLRNERTIVAMRGGRLLQVVGVDDGVTGHHDVARAFDGVADPRRALALTHDPRTANAIAQRGAGLILAGHTHGGQLHVPVVTKAVLQLAGMVYIAGWYRLGRARLYVNAGVGSSVVRLRAGRRGKPELALFELC
jgi:predicted MPP superfamily phosphohydrolase